MTQASQLPPTRTTLLLMRGRLDEVPFDRDIWVYCAVGQRAYYATRALLQRGRKIRNLSGGFRSWRSTPPAHD